MGDYLFYCEQHPLSSKQLSSLCLCRGILNLKVLADLQTYLGYTTYQNAWQCAWWGITGVVVNW